MVAVMETTESVPTNLVELEMIAVLTGNFTLWRTALGTERLQQAEIGTITS